MTHRMTTQRVGDFYVARCECGAYGFPTATQYAAGLEPCPRAEAEETVAAHHALVQQLLTTEQENHVENIPALLS